MENIRPTETAPPRTAPQALTFPRSGLQDVRCIASWLRLKLLLYLTCLRVSCTLWPRDGQGAGVLLHVSHPESVPPASRQVTSGEQGGVDGQSHRVSLAHAGAESPTIHWRAAPRDRAPLGQTPLHPHRGGDRGGVCLPPRGPVVAHRPATWPCSADGDRYRTPPDAEHLADHARRYDAGTP